MNSQTIFKLTVEISKNKLDTYIEPWKLLIETNRYYEIKPDKGSVKRIYKEKLNKIFDESKLYSNGYLYSSAFCTEDHIKDLYREVLENLDKQINSYMNELLTNQKTIKHQLLQTCIPIR
ncbi:hypothetical protein [Paenibacillus sp. DMB5]|uniref:hypothetical protein n=1 Tax=Paenibacillus sp. DMB5 TaxID=1780103 RepID=UPI00076C7BC3|nr:hypothetical protein [Paenibacillus sp. DMB5]KUP25809.1 hypothetical protein AWJ19_19490 [Paenibacillus sp. DMB5]